MYDFVNMADISEEILKAMFDWYLIIFTLHQFFKIKKMIIDIMIPAIKYGLSLIVLSNGNNDNLKFKNWFWSRMSRIKGTKIANDKSSIIKLKKDKAENNNALDLYFFGIICKALLIFFGNSMYQIND